MENWLVTVLFTLTASVITYLVTRRRVAELTGQLGAHEQGRAELQRQVETGRAELARLLQQEAARSAEADHRLAQLTFAIEEQKLAKQQAEHAKERLQLAKLEELKKTWVTHEKHVEEQIRTVCQRHTLAYVGQESFPHAGKPDNAVTVGDQLVIFDSKSPQGEDLSGFADYVKKQAEAASKYLFSNVCKEMYLVVPNNAAPTLPRKYFEFPDHKVFIITEEAIEPVLLSYKRIETYEFAEGLSPEDRDSVCALLGKFVYTLKRRVQVDQSFHRETFDVLADLAKLPTAIAKSQREQEARAKHNPPMAKAGKLIDVDQLQMDHELFAQRLSAELKKAA